MLPLVLVALAAGVLAVWMFKTPMLGTPGNSTPRTTVLDQPPFTYEQIERIAADGGEAGNPLCASIHRLLERQMEASFRYPGGMLIDVGFFTTKLERRHKESLGWPSTWYERSEKARYADAVRRTEFLPWRTDPSLQMLDADGFLPGAEMMSPQKRWSLNGNRMAIAYRPPVEETGGVKVNVDFVIRSIVASAGIVLLAFAFAALTVWLANLVFRRRKPMRGRWVKWLAAVVMLAIVLTLGLNNRVVIDEVTNFEMGQQQGTLAGGVYWSKSTVHRVEFRGDDVAQLLQSSDGDQRLAQAILAAAPSPDSPSAYLGVELSPESLICGGSTASYSRTIGLFGVLRMQFVRRPDAGAADFMSHPAGESVRLSNGVLRWRSCSGDPAQPLVDRSLNLQGLGTILLGLFLVWLLARLACVIPVRLMIRRRRLRGWCINCGYDLSHTSKAKAIVAGP